MCLFQVHSFYNIKTTIVWNQYWIPEYKICWPYNLIINHNKFLNIQSYVSFSYAFGELLSQTLHSLCLSFLYTNYTVQLKVLSWECVINKLSIFLFIKRTAMEVLPHKEDFVIISWKTYISWYVCSVCISDVKMLIHEYAFRHW